MTTKSSAKELVLGFSYDDWYQLGEKKAVTIKISPEVNSSILISGMSGCGKSYTTQYLLSKIYELDNELECYLADYKFEPAFKYLENCPRYYPYKKTLEALDIVYKKMEQRQAGLDHTRNAVLLVWDEYVPNMLALQNDNRNLSKEIMHMVSSILMLGRSLNVRLLIASQRPRCCRISCRCSSEFWCNHDTWRSKQRCL